MQSFLCVVQTEQIFGSSDSSVVLVNEESVCREEGVRVLGWEWGRQGEQVPDCGGSPEAPQESGTQEREWEV